MTAATPTIAITKLRLLLACLAWLGPRAFSRQDCRQTPMATSTRSMALKAISSAQAPLHSLQTAISASSCRWMRRIQISQLIRNTSVRVHSPSSKRESTKARASTHGTYRATTPATRPSQTCPTSRQTRAVSKDLPWSPRLTQSIYQLTNLTRLEASCALI